MTDSNFRVLLGSCERRGAWTVPAHIDARVTLGNLELDLREADLGPETTIEADVTLGNLEIIVPDDVAVDVDVESIAANVGHGPPDDDAYRWPSGRRLRVIGRVRFASCEVVPVGRRGMI